MISARRLDCGMEVSARDRPLDILQPHENAKSQNANERTVYGVIIAISVCHLLNDMMQSLLPAIYPNLKAQFGLSFVQIGLVTLAYQVTASLLQPLVGLYAD